MPSAKEITFLFVPRFTWLDQRRHSRKRFPFLYFHEEESKEIDVQISFLFWSFLLSSYADYDSEVYLWKLLLCEDEQRTRITRYKSRMRFTMVYRNRGFRTNRKNFTKGCFSFWTIFPFSFILLFLKLF